MSPRKTLRDLMHDYEKHIVIETYKRNASNREKTAHALGISMRCLEKIFARHAIGRRRYARKLPFPPFATLERKDPHEPK